MLRPSLSNGLYGLSGNLPNGDLQRTRCLEALPADRDQAEGQFVIVVPHKYLRSLYFAGFRAGRGEVDLESATWVVPAPRMKVP